MIGQIEALVSRVRSLSLAPRVPLFRLEILETVRSLTLEFTNKSKLRMSGFVHGGIKFSIVKGKSASFLLKITSLCLVPYSLQLTGVKRTKIEQRLVYFSQLTVAL